MRKTIESLTREYERCQKIAESCFDQLSEEELCQDSGETGNSVATLAWHLSGNLQSRFTDFLTADGEKEWRQREEEFQSRAVTKEELRAKWRRGWEVLLEALEGLKDEDLSRTVTIRGQGLTVIEALHRSVAHCAYHVGQMVFLAKGMRGAEWSYLSIAPGESEAYNRSPTRERPPE